MAVTNAHYSTPILSAEFDGLMRSIGYFEANPTIAVATSGGADSMALLLLAKDWAKANGGKVICLTVNHNLRKEAAAEAEQVAKWCKNIGIKHQTLLWQPPKNLGAIQETARTARYHLLTSYCRENNILHLLTAHHADDQVETILFRLARGSGLSGLSAMSAQNIISGVRHLRPLLTIPRARLLATLNERGQQWLEDPSNQNSDYSRVLIRKKLASLENTQDIKHVAGEVTKKIGNFRNLLENSLASQLTKAVDIYPMGYATIDTYFKMNSATLASIIQTLSGDEHPPRSEKLEKLCTAINNHELVAKRSLGGLLFEPANKEKIFVYRETKFIQKPLLLEVNTPALWDKRFFVSYNSAKKLPDAPEIRPLGSAGIAQVKKYSPALLRALPPDRIIRTIPALWLLEELLCVPHIGYMSKQATIYNFSCNMQFHPAKPLAGNGFFMNNL